MIVKSILTATAVLTVAVAPRATEFADRAVPDPATVSHIPELAWHAIPGSDDCEATCWDQHASNLHVAFEGGVNRRGGGLHDEPYEGSCEEKHPQCSPSFASVDEIREVIEGGDLKGLRTLLEKENTRIYVAAERGALQVVGCRGDVVAHLRIPPRMQALLAD